MNRVTARTHAMKLIYEWEMGGEGGEDTRIDLLGVQPGEEESAFMERMFSGVVENAAEIGDYLLAELHKIGGLKEVRGRGLMIGIEIDGSGPELRKKLLFDKHIFTGGAGASTVRLLPALCLTKEMADRFLTAFDKVKGEK